MDAKIIAIGNSKGVRIPRNVLDKLRLREGDPIEIELGDQSIVLRLGYRARAGWAEQFAHNPAVSEDLWSDLPIDEAWDR